LILAGEENMDHKQEQERREIRRRRRIRNQIGAYAILLLCIGAMAAAITLGTNWMKQRQTQENEIEREEVLEEILASEESLPEPGPSIETPPTEMVEEPSPEELLDEMINGVIAAMPLEDKVAGLFFVTPESITGVSTAIKAGEGTQEALEKYAVGGVIYSTKNMKSTDQLREMIANTGTFSRYPLFFGVDEEGGSVSRLDSSGLAEGTDSAAKIGAANDPDQAYQAALTIGDNLASLGFNTDFAPVADIANIEGSVMADRSFGSDGATVSPYVVGMLNGLAEKGITGCLKHFPGIGATTADTHDGISISERTAEEFRAQEFSVFRAGMEAGAKMVMVGHIAAPALTGDNTPCSISEVIVTDILRQELGFDGVIITDAMDMGAISTYYDAGEAAIMALKAGCDMVLMPEDFEKAYSEVLQAVSEGTIAEERINDSLKRIYRIKYGETVIE
jgi:beta-N-acetylhexosaminidase